MTTTPELDPVRLIEDTIDATSESPQALCAYGCSCSVPTTRTAEAILAALLEAGWQPPAAPTTPGTTTAVPDKFVIEFRVDDDEWVQARTMGPIVGREDQELALRLLDWYRSLHPHTIYRLVREDIIRTRTVIDPGGQGRHLPIEP